MRIGYMRNDKFIIHNKAISFDDYEIFEFIVSILKLGLLSNEETEYCHCSVRQYETKELVCIFNKTKNNYRIDVYEKKKM